MNPTYLTLTHKLRHLDRADDIVDAWRQGEPFRMYEHGPVTVQDTVRMRMAGFTHVTFVWKIDDEPVRSHTILLV